MREGGSEGYAQLHQRAVENSRQGGKHYINLNTKST